MIDNTAKSGAPGEIKEDDLGRIVGGVMLLLPDHGRLPDGTKASETIALLPGDGSVRIITGTNGKDER